MVPHGDRPRRRPDSAAPRIIAAMLLAIDIGNTNVTIGLLRGGRARGDPPRGDERARDGRRARAAARWPAAPRRRLVRRRRRDRLRVGRAGADRARRGHRRPPRAAADRRRGRDRAARRPGRPAGRGRRRSPGQRPGRGAAVRHAGGRRRLRDGHDARLRRRRRRLRRRRDRARASSSASRRSRPGPPSCRGSSCARPDRAIGRDTVSAMQSGTIFGYQALATGLLRAGPAGARRRWPASSRGDVKAILTGGLSAAPWAAGARGHRRDRPRPHAQGPRHPPRRGRRRRAAGARAAVTDGRAAGSPAGSSRLGVTGSIAAYKAVELLRLLRAEGADVAVMLTPVRDPVRRAADVRGPVAPSGRDRHPRAAARRPDRPHRRRRQRRRDRRRARRPRTASGRWPTGWPATS